MQHQDETTSSLGLRHTYAHLVFFLVYYYTYFILHNQSSINRVFRVWQLLIASYQTVVFYLLFCVVSIVLIQILEQRKV